MRTILWVNPLHRWSWMERLWRRLSSQNLTSTLGQGYMEGTVFQRATNRFSTLTKGLNSRAVRWLWRSAKPAFGSEIQKVYPWASTQYVWDGTAQAQGWDFSAQPRQGRAAGMDTVRSLLFSEEQLQGAEVNAQYLLLLLWPMMFFRKPKPLWLLHVAAQHVSPA